MRVAKHKLMFSFPRRVTRNPSPASVQEIAVQSAATQAKVGAHRGGALASVMHDDDESLGLSWTRVKVLVGMILQNGPQIAESVSARSYRPDAAGRASSGMWRSDAVAEPDDTCLAELWIAGSISSGFGTDVARTRATCRPGSRSSLST